MHVFRLLYLQHIHTQDKGEGPLEYYSTIVTTGKKEGWRINNTKKLQMLIHGEDNVRHIKKRRI
jgi:hypothetical protein